MKSQSMHYSGRRSRRGRRRHSGSSRGATTPKPKLTFWQRVVAFFAGDTKKTTVTPPKPNEKPAAATVAAPKEKISRKPELVEFPSHNFAVVIFFFDANKGIFFHLLKGVGKAVNPGGVA